MKEEREVRKGGLEVTSSFLQMPFAPYRFTRCTIFARKSRFAWDSLQIQNEREKEQSVIPNFLLDFLDEVTYAYSLNAWRPRSTRFTLKHQTDIIRLTERGLQIGRATILTEKETNSLSEWSRWEKERDSTIRETQNERERDRKRDEKDWKEWHLTWENV